MAEDISLVGLRKKLKRAEVVEKGIKTVEREIEAVGRAIKAAEETIEETVSFGGLTQAGTVVGAEAFDFSHLLILFLIDW